MKSYFKALVEINKINWAWTKKHWKGTLVFSLVGMIIELFVMGQWLGVFDVRNIFRKKEVVVSEDRA